MLLLPGRWVAGLLTALLSIALAALGIFRSDDISSSPPPNQDVSGSPSQENSAASEPPEFVGIVLPSEAVDVTARVDGQVEEIRVRTGDRLQRGALIAVLDTAALSRVELIMAETEVRAAESETHRLSLELAQAQERLSRVAALSRQQLVTGEQLEDVKYQEQLAAAKVKSAEFVVAQKRALVEQRTTQLLNLQVRAPFDGTVAARYVDRGSAVGRGTPLIRLVQTAPVKLRFAVPSSESSLLRIGLPIVARIHDIGLVVGGRVETVAPEIDSSSQTVVAEAVLAISEQEASARTIVGRTASATFSAVPDASIAAGPHTAPR